MLNLMNTIELKLFEFRFGLSILWSLHERLTQDSSIIGAVKIFMLDLRLQAMLTWHLALARGKRDKTSKDFAEPKPRLAFRK